MNRIFTVVLSVILFAILFSLLTYVPVSQREPNVYYFGFFETMLFVIVYSGPIYLLLGLPLSILVDMLIDKFGSKAKLKRYFIGVGAYSLAGVLAGLVLLLIFGVEDVNLTNLMLLSIAASNLFFHLSLVVPTNGPQRQRNH